MLAVVVKRSFFLSVIFFFFWGGVGSGGFRDGEWYVAKLVRVGAGEANRDVFSRLSLRGLSIACLWALLLS